MSKDLALLSGVSKLFTEETLKDILRKSTNENDVQLTGWTFVPRTNKGDSYLSHVDRVTVYGKIKDTESEVKLVVKSLPKNIGRRKTFRSEEFFYNEITFYNEIIPVFNKFIESKGQKHLLTIPDCLAAITDGENDYLALQDVGVLGFGPVTRFTTLDLEQMNFLLKAMAEFHAVSFAFKDQNKEKYDELADKLRETYFGDTHWKWYENFRAILVRVANDALQKEYPGHPAEIKFSSMPIKEMFDRSYAFCKRWHNQTSVINQGDSWAPNFLMRNVGDNGEKQALLLDFQLARSSSPVLDLSFLIYSCSDEDLLVNHFDEMLKTYYTILCSGIKSLGSEPEKLYPWSTFQEEVQEQSIHGLTFAIEAVPFTMMDESEAFDLDNLIKGDEAVDVAEIFQVKNIKTAAGRRRLANLIIHAHSRGFL